jgi:nitrite reductase (NO-forming)
MSVNSISRRELLRIGTGFAAGAATAMLLGHRGRTTSPVSAATVRAESYGHGVEPPADLDPAALASRLYPPPARSGRESDVIEADLWISEQLEISLRNLGARPHNLHLHGRHDVAQDGWQPVPPQGQARYRLRAEPFGLHPYHCDASPAAEHLSHGLYGMLIVDPPQARPPAHEVVLVLSGFDLDGDGHNELYGWNGVAGGFERYPIKVPAGELVRVYLLNMVADDPVASFHLHAETFAVYRSGTRLTPDERTDVVTLAQTERAILEFRLPRRGRYMFHPHQRHMAERGAMGWFAAV